MCSNGGKDATVVFHLAGIALADMQSDPLNASDMFPLRGLMFTRKDGFVEELEFAQAQAELFCVDVTYSHSSYVEGVKEAVEMQSARGFVMGTRRTDPHGAEQTSFCPSSPGWPPFFRVNPILDWHLADVWGFLVRYGFNYCLLYDQGYASLGTRSTTQRTPSLIKEDGGYRPAHSVVLDDSVERSGREGSNPPSPDLLPTKIEAGTAAVVVVARTLLQGARDRNSSALVSALYGQGVDVNRYTRLLCIAFNP